MKDIRQQVKEAISRMTIREKALALTGVSMFHLGGTGSLPHVRFLDGGTGAAYHQMFIDCFYRLHQTGKNAADELIDDASGLAERMLRLRALVLGERSDPTPEEAEEAERLRAEMESYLPGGVLPGCFPPGIVLGAGWNPEAVYELGQAIGAEADYYHIDVLLGTPNVNIHRDPRGGRLFEGYSEDPCLVSKLAPAFVRGVQSQGIAANVKHFAANNQETDRRTVNEHIPIRALHEIYFPGFRACVQEGGCKTVMSAYNAINGVPCAQNEWLLTDTLRRRWGFEGFVVSDWSAVYDQVAALKAGNDVDMPGPRDVDAVVDAVDAGALDERVLDRSLLRVWSTLLSLPCCAQGHRAKSIDREFSRRAAYRAAAEGLVLLKNENRTLPLPRAAIVGVYGDKSMHPIECGGGSANIITDRHSNLFDCIRDMIGRGNARFSETPPDAQAIIVTVGAGGQEGFDRKSLSMDEGDQAALSEAVRSAKEHKIPVIAVLNTCGPVDLTPWLADLDAVVCMFIPGMEGSRACADALFGRINPSGKLPLTFPRQYRDCPTSTSFPGWNEEVWYGEDIFVGYRYYDYRGVEPLFPFGFGLSYTSFDFPSAALSEPTLHLDGDSVTLRVTVRNTGSVPGQEVVQVYIGQESPTLVKPPKELKHFQKVALAPGEKKDISFLLESKDFASFDTRLDDWCTEPGLYHIYVGNSSRSIFHVLDLKLEGHDPYGFDAATAMGAVAATPGALDALYRHCPSGVGITKQAIEESVLYQASGSLGAYWKTRIEPLLTGTGQEKQAQYEQMLADLNRFK